MVRHFPPETVSRQQAFQQQCFADNSRHSSFQQDRTSAEGLDRQDSFQPTRYAMDSTEQPRFHEVNYDISRRQPPMQIDQALKSHCGIAARQYFVAAISDDGKPMTFFSPGQRLNETVIRQFFDVAKFQQVMARIESGQDPILDDVLSMYEGNISRNGSFGRMRASDRRRSSIFDDWGSPARQGRKRPRPRTVVNEEDDAPMTVSSRRGIKVGDSEAVWNFYEQRFKNCQQTACKLIAKAWVKAVEPKKQSTHPYTGSDEKAPDWWPKPWGPTKDDKVRHKEPDHLYKRERVHLLAHILRLVIEPNGRQHADVQKLGLNVKKLEEATSEALSSFFMDNETNAKKKPYLTEIFKVARQEERFKNGEIDESTEVYVMTEDRVPENYASDEDGTQVVKEEDEAELQLSQPNGNTHIHPGQPPIQGPPPSSQGIHDSHGSFMGDLPVRGTPFNPNILPGEMQPQAQAQAQTQPHHSFVDSSAIAVNDPTGAMAAATGSLTLDMVQSPHDNSRRPSVFSEYASPGGTTMYAQPWQQPGSGGPGSSAVYSFTPAQNGPAQGSFMGHGMPMNTSQSFMGGSFEGSPPRQEFDANGAPIFRGGEMSHHQMNQQQGYFVPNEQPGDLRVVTTGVSGMSRAQM